MWQIDSTDTITARGTRPPTLFHRLADGPTPPTKRFEIYSYGKQRLEFSVKKKLRKFTYKIPTIRYPPNGLI